MTTTTPKPHNASDESDDRWRAIWKDTWRTSPELRRATFFVAGVPFLMAVFVATTALVAAIRGVAGPMLLLSVAFHTALHPIDLFGFGAQRMAADVAHAGGMTGLSQAGALAAVLTLCYLTLELFLLVAAALVLVVQVVREGVAALIDRQGA